MFYRFIYNVGVMDLIKFNNFEVRTKYTVLKFYLIKDTYMLKIFLENYGNIQFEEILKNLINHIKQQPISEYYIYPKALKFLESMPKNLEVAQMYFQINGNPPYLQNISELDF